MAGRNWRYLHRHRRTALIAPAFKDCLMILFTGTTLTVTVYAC
jgi:hypothetical protein